LFYNISFLTNTTRISALNRCNSADLEPALGALLSWPLRFSIFQLKVLPAQSLLFYWCPACAYLE